MSEEKNLEKNTNIENLLTAAFKEAGEGAKGISLIITDDKIIGMSQGDVFSLASVFYRLLGNKRYKSAIMTALAIEENLGRALDTATDKEENI